MNISALIIDVTLWGSVLILGFMAWQRGRVVLVSSVREGSMDFINIVPRIALGVIGSGYIAAVIPPEVITGWLGPDSGWLGVLTAVIAGAATPGGPVVGFSIGAVALKVGGGPPQVIAYVVAWALFAFQRMILWEIPFMPARFVWFRAAVSLPFPFLAAAIAMADREAVSEERCLRSRRPSRTSQHPRLWLMPQPNDPGRLIYVKGRSTGKSTIEAAGVSNGGKHENDYENGGRCCVDVRMCGIVFAWLVRSRRHIAVDR